MQNPQRTIWLFVAIASLSFFAALAFANLSKDDLEMLQDPGGWEYVTVSDQDAGIQTEHVCFDGQPHPNQCSGKLTVNADETFVAEINIHGQDVDRHGTYKIDGNQISFFDEFGTRDGPYALQINGKTKTLVLSMPQVRMELELEKQYKDDLEQKKPPTK